MQTQEATMANFMVVRAGIILLLIAAMMQLAACEHKEAGGQAKTGQVIARVNGDEITISQLNYELQHGNVKPAQQALASQQIVQGLIDRQIVEQAALKASLDRKLGVLQAIENAKALVLVQAYFEEKVAAVAKPTEAEVDDYYAKHPDLFANRKVYLMDELSLPAASYSKELNAVADSAKTLEVITQWLDQHGLKYNHAQATHAAETLPLALRTQLLKMVTGDIIFIRAQEGILIGRIQAVKDAPVAQSDAKRFIERGLMTEKRKAVAEAELKNLRASSKIVFLDDKYKLDTTAAVVEKPAEEAKPAETTTKPTETNKPVASHIEKGLSGL